jgi:hypothetical protein
MPPTRAFAQADDEIAVIHLLLVIILVVLVVRLLDGRRGL